MRQANVELRFGHAIATHEYLIIVRRELPYAVILHDAKRIFALLLKVTAVGVNMGPQADNEWLIGTTVRLIASNLPIGVNRNLLGIGLRVGKSEVCGDVRRARPVEERGRGFVMPEIGEVVVARGWADP